MESKLPEPGGTTDEDVISSLPDDVLLRILSFVPTEDAVCTRALSRRWRHVWLCLPDLAFSDIGKTPTSGLEELIDAVLAHSHDTLTIHIQHPRHKLRANAWLQQAAERVHGKFSLRLDDYRPITIEDRQWHWNGFGNVALDLPCGGDARTAAMSFCSFLQDDKVTILRLPAAPAANSSLTELELVNIQLEVGSLSDFLSSCGQLRRLVLNFIWVIDGPDLRISNKLLEELDLDYISGGVERLEVSCPKLRSLRINRHFAAPDCEMVARFCTPCLEEIYWPHSDTLRKRSRVEFLGNMDMVRRLNVGLLTHVHVQTYQSRLGLWLVRSCTGVHRLDVSLWNRTKNDDPDNDVVNLMEELPELSSVTHLRVTTQTWPHMFGASIAKLLSRCCRLQSLDVHAEYPSMPHACPADCPCKRPLEWKEWNLSLDFLKHIEIYNKYDADCIHDLDILLRRSSKAKVEMRT